MMGTHATQAINLEQNSEIEQLNKREFLPSKMEFLAPTRFAHNENFKEVELEAEPLLSSTQIVVEMFSIPSDELNDGTRFPGQPGDALHLWGHTADGVLKSCSSTSNLRVQSVLDRAFRHCAALGNSGGGYFIAGVSEALQITGVALTKKDLDIIQMFPQHFRQNLTPHTPATMVTVHSRPLQLSSTKRGEIRRCGQRTHSSQQLESLSLFLLVFVVHSTRKKDVWLRERKSNRIFRVESGAIYIDDGMMASSVVGREASLPVPTPAPSEGGFPLLESQGPVLTQFLAENQGTKLITGRTGSGKSTVVPFLLMGLAARQRGGRAVIIAEPRRLSVVRLASYLSRKTRHELGTTIGYAIGSFQQVSPNSFLIFVTYGLLQRLLADCMFQLGMSGEVASPLIRAVANAAYIVFDEIHERNLDADVCLSLTKRFILMQHQKRYPDPTQMVLMSATTPQSIISYFNLSHRYEIHNVQHHLDILYMDSKRICRARQRFENIVKFLTPKLPVRSFWPNERSDPARSQMLATEASVTLCLIIHCLSIGYLRPPGQSKKAWRHRIRRGQASVIVFLPGISHIISIEQKLATLPTANLLHICVLHSMYGLGELDEMIAQIPNGKLKVYLATSIAETSVTLPNAHVVIDSMLTREVYKTRNGILGTNELRTVFISQHSSIQRAGRTGRVAPGMVVRLLPESTFDFLAPESQPEMLRRDINDAVLTLTEMRALDVYDILKDTPNPPSEIDVRTALQDLEEVGAIRMEADRFVPTAFGRLKNHIPLSLPALRLILFGAALDLTEIAVVLAVASDRRDVIKSPRGRPDMATYNSVRFAMGVRSDAIASYNAYTFWLRNRSSIAEVVNGEIVIDPNKEFEFADHHGLSLFFLNEFDATVLDVLRRLNQLGLARPLSSEEEERRRFFTKNMFSEPERRHPWSVEDMLDDDEADEAGDDLVFEDYDVFEVAAIQMMSEDRPVLDTSSISAITDHADQMMDRALRSSFRAMDLPGDHQSSTTLPYLSFHLDSDTIEMTNLVLILMGIAFGSTSYYLTQSGILHDETEVRAKCQLESIQPLTGHTGAIFSRCSDSISFPNIERFRVHAVPSFRIPLPLLAVTRCPYYRRRGGRSKVKLPYHLDNEPILVGSSVLHPSPIFQTAFLTKNYKVSRDSITYPVTFDFNNPPEQITMQESVLIGTNWLTVGQSNILMRGSLFPFEFPAARSVLAFLRHGNTGISVRAGTDGLKQLTFTSQHKTHHSLVGSEDQIRLLRSTHSVLNQVVDEIAQEAIKSIRQPQRVDIIGIRNTYYDLEDTNIEQIRANLLYLMREIHADCVPMGQSMSEMLKILGI